MGYLFLCVVFKVYHEYRMLIFRVLHGRGLLYPAFWRIGVFQVLIDVLHLEKLEKLQVFCLFLRLVLS